jgi:hypothetical protein
MALKSNLFAMASSIRNCAATVAAIVSAVWRKRTVICRVEKIDGDKMRYYFWRR